MVSAFAAGGPCRAVVNVDQPLALADFQTTVRELEPALRGSEAEFQTAIGAVFDAMAGPLDGPERRRVDHVRTADQDVVLGVWDLLFTAPADDLNATVDALAGAITVPYLSLHGIDPGPDYAAWLTSRIPSATVDVWPDQGHYPHLIHQDRFVERVREFDPATPLAT